MFGELDLAIRCAVIISFSAKREQAHRICTVTCCFIINVTLVYSENSLRAYKSVIVLFS